MYQFHFPMSSKISVAEILKLGDFYYEIWRGHYDEMISLKLVILIGKWTYVEANLNNR